MNSAESLAPPVTWGGAALILDQPRGDPGPGWPVDLHGAPLDPACSCHSDPHVFLGLIWAQIFGTTVEELKTLRS